MSHPTQRRILAACVLMLSFTAAARPARAEMIEEIRGEYLSVFISTMTIGTSEVLVINFLSGTVNEVRNSAGAIIPSSPFIGETVDNLGSLSLVGGGPGAAATLINTSGRNPAEVKGLSDQLMVTMGDFIGITCSDLSAPYPFVAFLFPDPAMRPAFLEMDVFGPGSFRLTQDGVMAFRPPGLIGDLCPGVDLSILEGEGRLTIEFPGSSLSGGAGSPFGPAGSSVGGATFRFSPIPIPEPTSLTLGLIGVAGMAAGWARRRLAAGTTSRCPALDRPPACTPPTTSGC